MSASRPRALTLFLIAALVIPLGAAALLSWSVTDRADRVGDVPVAIVNDDEIVTGDTPMAAGRALSSALVHPEDDTFGLGWTLTSAEDAAAGLAAGEYYAVLTIPEDFSQSVLSVGTDAPVSAEVTLETNPAASAVGALAAQAVTEAATQALGAQVTDAFVTQTITGMNSVAQSLTDAADGAEQLASGAGQLADGTATLADSSAQLASGLSQAATGTQGLATGTEQIASASSTLASSAGQLAGGASQLSSGSSSVSAAASGVAGGAQQLSSSMTALAASCPAVSSSPQFCASLSASAQAAATLASSAAQTASGAAGTASAAASVASGASQLATGATQLADGAAQVADGATQAADGVSSAASGATQLAAGAYTLAGAATELAGGTESLAEGLAEGAAQVPVTSEEDAETLAEVVTTPVTVATDETTSADGWLAATIAALVLWLGSLATLVAGRRVYSRASLDSPASTGRLSGLLLRPRLAIAAVHALVTVGVIGMFGLPLNAAVGFTGVALLAAGCFALLLSALEAAWGRWGLIGFGILTAAQAASSAVLPLQTAPPVFGTLNQLLPGTAFASLAASLAGDPDGSSALSAITVLLVWSVLGAAGVRWGIRRRRALTGSHRSAITVAGGAVAVQPVAG
ncbi:YhgE/Pip domain-containing protein [Microbacterium sp. bgisy207]|uniref:YhgE/Pip domain-containing protein n=1 Tax=Microbacterium sp. bgisy207 TaxID=3413800 RepID=UPI003EB69B5D